MKNIKLYIILFLIFICSSFNIEVNAITQPTSNIYKEGIYQASDLNIPENKFYTVQNFSKTILLSFNFLMDMEKWYKL